MASEKSLVGLYDSIMRDQWCIQWNYNCSTTYELVHIFEFVLLPYPFVRCAHLDVKNTYPWIKLPLVGIVVGPNRLLYPPNIVLCPYYVDDSMLNDTVALIWRLKRYLRNWSVINSVTVLNLKQKSTFLICFVKYLNYLERIACLAGCTFVVSNLLLRKTSWETWT